MTLATLDGGGGDEDEDGARIVTRAFLASEGLVDAASSTTGDGAASVERSIARFISREAGITNL